MGSTLLQMAELGWAPELRFFEQRTAVLRELEDAGLLTAFRIADDEAGARLGDGDHEIEYSPRRFVGVARGADADVDRVLRAFRIVVGHLTPKRFTAPTFFFRHIEPLEVDYEAARKTAVTGVLGSVEVGPVIATDFANLVDGLLTEPAATGQAEYGVVTAEELADRLQFSGFGRVNGIHLASEQPAQVDTSQLPPVGLFVEAQWTLVDRLTADDAFKDAWDACRTCSEAFASSLSERVFAGLKSGGN